MTNTRIVGTPAPDLAVNEYMYRLRGAFEAPGAIAFPVTIDYDHEVTDAKESLTYRLTYVRGDAAVPEVIAWLETLQVVGIDTETSGLDPRKGAKLATIQLGNPMSADPRVYVIDVRCLSSEALAALGQAVMRRSLRKHGQNLKFECKFLQYHLGWKLRNLSDTQMTELVVRCGLLQKKGSKSAKGEDRAAYRHTSMAALARRYLNLDIDKDHDLRTSFYSTPAGQHSPRQLVYAAGDVVYIFRIAEKQARVVQERGLRPVCKVEYGNIPILADAELTGIQLDTLQWTKLWQEAVQRRVETERYLDQLVRPLCPQQDMFDVGVELTRPIYPKTNKPINYGSPVQLKWVLATYCKSIQWDHEIVTDYKRLTQLQAQYGDEWLKKRRKRNAKLIEEGKADEVQPVDVTEVPWHLIPERKYTLLLDTDKFTLTLAMLRGQLPRQLVRLLLDLSQYATREETFGIDFINKNVDPITGRIYTEFHQCVTNTGRVSTSPNLQNIPKDARYRKCFIARRGYKLVLADFSQIEPRLSAQVSGDPVYTAAFTAGRDLYVEVAEAMFQCTVDKKTEEGAKLRQLAKAIVLGLAYRMGPWKLRDSITLALADAILAGEVECPTFEYIDDLYTKFFAACSGIKEYQELCSTLADPKQTTRKKLWDDFADGPITWIEGPCGRKRFFDSEAKAVFTEAPNAPIQGCSATITKAASILFQDALDERGWADDVHIINLVHDEILVECREDLADDCAVLLKTCMEQAAAFYLPDIPAIAEFPENSRGVVDYWCKAVKEAA